ncbi:hypothetical protein HNO88_000509 [Novosphingobium chloroacetimidivorans]|uniref:Uncharacterized protein n=1 Tax=Novosphingobium chloroacetimidivorans TaxID=1428314 RepID=A0A7W7K6P4_9SPHN|nr:hypothetical protein [Novosphingobium chloroacetimidivorans]MBB4857202.1 hypothetical protein [Novosphingobium chloroacetimidivorans]
MAITLPAHPAPNDVNPTILDFGVTLRPATGGPVLKVGRPGSRLRIAVSYPPMEPPVASRFISRLLEAKRTGHLIIKFPLLGLNQGSPGAPVIDGAGQAGTTLTLRGLTPNYRVKEGYWLSIIDASGQHYVHNARTTIAAGADGTVSFQIEPPLRKPFADGATVLLAQPMIEGFIDGGEWSWSTDTAHHTGLSFVLEEAS